MTQWLTDLVRLTLAADDQKSAHTAAQACQTEAAAEARPARAAVASLRCQGLLTCDLGPLAKPSPTTGARPRGQRARAEGFLLDYGWGVWGV